MMVWLSEPADLNFERLKNSKPVTIDVKTYPIQIPAPQEGLGADFVSLPLTDFLVIPVGHWSQTLWANLLGLGPYLWRELVGDNPFTMIFRLGLAMLLSLSKEPSKLIRRFVRTGKGCKIHPSAVVEGSLLGDYVTVGANAVVRGCILRDGVRVEDLAIVEGSVLSEGAVVQRQGMVKYSVLAEGAAVAGVMQLGVLASNASVKRGGYLMDMNFGGLVNVQYNGLLKQAPLGLIGCGVGEDTTIGLGVSVAAGRFIPSNLKVVMHPDAMLRSVAWSGSLEESSLVCVDQGKLRGLNVR
jgi:hypothetical protein